MKPMFFLSLLLTLALAACATSPRAGQTMPERLRITEAGPLPEFNTAILEVMASYPTDGTHDYWWPKSGEGGGYDGASQDVFLQGVKVMDGEPLGRTFCCGLTLEVFAKAYDVYTKEHAGGAAPSLTPEAWADFQKLWFVLEVNGDGPGSALEKYGLGRTIKQEEVVAGDFVQIWRYPKKGKKVGSGHSVVFLNWVKDRKGRIKGFRYWSTQKSTKGIHDNTEYFGKPGQPGKIAAENTHWSRAEVKAGG
jgi:hypothetical protein